MQWACSLYNGIKCKPVHARKSTNDLNNDYCKNWVGTQTVS